VYRILRCSELGVGQRDGSSGAALRTMRRGAFQWLAPSSSLRVRRAEITACAVSCAIVQLGTLEFTATARKTAWVLRRQDVWVGMSDMGPWKIFMLGFVRAAGESFSSFERERTKRLILLSGEALRSVRSDWPVLPVAPRMAYVDIFFLGAFEWWRCAWWCGVLAAMMGVMIVKGFKNLERPGNVLLLKDMYIAFTLNLEILNGIIYRNQSQLRYCTIATYIPVYHGFRGMRDYPKSLRYYNEIALATLFVGETPPISRAMAPIAS
jgi:hypothetical protein